MKSAEIMTLVDKGKEKVVVILEDTNADAHKISLKSLSEVLDTIQETDVASIGEGLKKTGVAQELAEIVIRKKKEELTEEDLLTLWLVDLCCALSPMDSNDFIASAIEDPKELTMLKLKLAGQFI